MESSGLDRAPNRTIALVDDDVDRLEQVLIGAAPAKALVHALGLDRVSAEEVVLCDSESTPIGRYRAGALAPLRPLARGSGPQWDPAVRRAPSELWDGDGHRDRLTVALAIASPPSIQELRDVEAEVARVHADRLLLVALVSRGIRSSSTQAHPRVGPEGLVRSVQAAAAELSARLGQTRVVPLAVPWPLRATDDLHEREGEVRELLACFGATTILVGGDQNLIEDDDADLLLPATSRTELARARSRSAQPPATIFFTGLSGSGKSTIARALAAELRARLTNEVVLLDGDEVRRRVSQDLGFDRASRNTNVARIAEAAAEIVSNGGVAIAAPIAPFEEGRARAREIASAVGPFLLVYVSTPLHVCEERDRKGLYAKARTGEVKEFTGISSPYDPPRDATLVIDASVLPVEEAVKRILEELGRLTPTT
jgi:sulfate adenylyltransferase